MDILNRKPQNRKVKRFYTWHSDFVDARKFFLTKIKALRKFEIVDKKSENAVTQIVIKAYNSSFIVVV